MIVDCRLVTDYNYNYSYVKVLYSAPTEWTGTLNNESYA